jgi:MFS family permease
MVAGIYLPQLLFGIGQGAIAPIIVFSALDLGASTPMAGFVAGLVGLGHVLGDLPAGQLAARIGERRAMQVAVALLLVALAGCILAPSLWVFGIAVGATGLSVAVWGLARHLYLTEVVPFEFRARALSTLGGVQRIGLFIGPFLGAVSLTLVETDGPYWVFVVGAVAASAALVATRRTLPEHDAKATDPSVRGLVTVVSEHARLLRTLGTAALLVGALRASRQVVIPLWGNEIGLDAATTSIVFGLSGAIDMLLFYPAGKAMDRFGRRWVAVPSMAVLGLAFLLLPLTRDVTSMAAVALLMGVGNGMSSGIIMTISSDAAPAGERGQFLAAFRVISDTGMMAGPFVIGAVAAASALIPAILAAGAVGGLASLALARWVPRHPIETDGQDVEPPIVAP